MSLHLNILCTISNLTFHLKFTIDANIVYILVKSKFSTSIVCPNHHSQYFYQLVYHFICCVLTYLMPAV